MTIVLRARIRKQREKRRPEEWSFIKGRRIRDKCMSSMGKKYGKSSHPLPKLGKGHVLQKVWVFSLRESRLRKASLLIHRYRRAIKSTYVRVHLYSPDRLQELLPLKSFLGFHRLHSKSGEDPTGHARFLRRLKISFLNANLDKSQIITGGVEEQAKNIVLECIGFQEEVLPLKYLGVPITLGRLLKVEHRNLVDKLTVRIKVASQPNGKG
ncbi:hypothetical protein Cgig2_026557 [Carnegiea gigantea]|uniref:Uncharacterized protein n=1 Tax=Carnegiea gigantea TaxID=171969 RepID=A0A9Q1Q9L8_9CARY|nr:hypothetical protein Cgig2_026557 [Carnegiea gigantea]